MIFQTYFVGPTVPSNNNDEFGFLKALQFFKIKSYQYQKTTYTVFQPLFQNGKSNAVSLCTEKSLTAALLKISKISLLKNPSKCSKLYVKKTTRKTTHSKTDTQRKQTSKNMKNGQKHLNR